MSWRSTRRGALVLAVSLAVAGCDRSSTPAPDEVAAELRALRQALLAQPQAAAARTPNPNAADIATALAPLREALEGLADNQRDLQQRQLALTQELQRWSTLLVETTGSARRDEGEALAKRLQQLEASLQAQDVRHREVEALMQGALERTADRLGEFLQRVGADVPTEATTTPAGAGSASATPAAPVPADATPPASGASSPPPSGDGTGAQWQRRAGTSWWWGGAALLATFAGVWCLRRLRQPGAFSGTAGQRQPPTWSPATTSGGGDADVQEIWAAAALLGEAVGRLRDSTTAGEPVTETEVAAADDEWVVLDDELLAPVATPLNRAPVGEQPTMPSEPSIATCRLRSEDPAGSMQSVLAILQSDPRVLRRPEPAVRCSHEWLEVSFRLLPELPPGERSHIEQRLRDACRPGA